MVYLDELAMMNECELRLQVHDFRPQPPEAKNIAVTIIHSSWVSDDDGVTRAELIGSHWLKAKS